MKISSLKKTVINKRNTVSLKLVTTEHLIILHLHVGFKTTIMARKKNLYLLNPLQKWLKPVLIALTMTV